MANITVHLTISGLIALQPVVDTTSDYKWRVVVPDFTQHHHAKHAPFIALNVAEMVIPPAGNSPYTVIPLKSAFAEIDHVKSTTTSSVLPDELLTLIEACDGSTADCRKVKARAQLKPALELWIADAEVSATFIDETVPWYLERSGTTGGAVKNPKKGPKAAVAEEICLTFTTDEPSFKLVLQNGTTQTIELRPAAGKDTVEIALRNIGPPQPAGHENEDPHFQMYYEIVERPPVQKARLKNDRKAGGTPTKRHDHQLIGAEATPPPAPKGDLSLLGQFVMSMTGSNCPPIGGDPYP